MTKQSSGWRSFILQHFSESSSKASRLTVVSDPDGLLTEPGVVGILSAQEFELVTFGDPVAFRYAYESRFRQHWDRGEGAHLVVVVRNGRGELNQIPYDLLAEAHSSGRILSFSLGQLFPTLAPSVLSELDAEHFDVVANALEYASSENLGTNATRDFILRHVYQIAPELIKEPADLLRALLRHHYRAQVVPESIDARFVEVLTQNQRWLTWPLERIVPNRKAFIEFVGERWPLFLFTKGLELVPGRETARPSVPGPLELPFDHGEVRMYVERYFAEGLLEPTAVVRPIGSEDWFAVGVVGSPSSSSASRFHQLFSDLSATVPQAETASHQDWQDYSLRWGTWHRLRWQTVNERDEASEAAARELAVRAENEFAAWLVRRFATLPTLSYLPRPVLGHHIPHYLAQQLGIGELERVALIVLDGMAIDQWRIIRDSLNVYRIEEQAMFSWIPTLTPISRQAIFSGRMPFEYESSIDSTYRESQHWSTFWQDHGLHEQAVRFVRPQGDGESTHSVLQRLLDAAEPNVTALGGVIGFIDQSLHHVVRGMPGLHAIVDEWADSRELSVTVDELLHRGFAVFVTADHGNAFGRGIGKPNVGVTAHQRGERAHIFRNESFLENTAAQYPGAIKWPQIGLPSDYFPLLAPHGACFIPESKESVSHGGISIGEVMVPFVRILEST